MSYVSSHDHFISHVFVWKGFFEVVSLASIVIAHLDASAMCWSVVAVDFSSE